MPKPDEVQLPPSAEHRRPTSRTTSPTSSSRRYGAQAGLRRRPARDDDDRPRPAEARPQAIDAGAAALDRARARRSSRSTSHTGAVLAMVGGRNYHQSQFNLATQGERQPGSAFKPFVLAAALRAGDLAGDDARLGPGDDRRRRQALVRQQLRAREPRPDRPLQGDRRTPTTRSSRS